MKFLTPFGACIVLLGLISSCNHQPEAAAGSSLYFSSPAASVDVIKSLTGASDWTTLGHYYDLTGTGLTRAEVSRESFHVSESPSLRAQPAGIGRFKELFPPSFSFESATPDDAAGIVIVTVGLKIEQGGGPMQHVVSTYRLRHSRAGYQLLPKVQP